MSDDKIYGLDLGTTNSCLSVLEDGRPRIVPIDGSGVVPSVVSLDGQNVVVGRRAWNRAAAFPEVTVKSVKRLMGGGQKVALGSREYRPEEISALILGYLAEEARRLEGLRVKRAVITVPAYFSDAQRRATLEAGELAGLKVERIVNEPTAAALFYDQIRLGGEEAVGPWKHALVYDLGGGTFDVSILRLSEIIEVLTSLGDTRLGGDDFDARLVSRLIGEIREQGGPDLSGFRPALARLGPVAERVKIELSERGTARVEETGIPVPSGRPVTLSTEISRSEFEGLTAHLLERTLDFVDQALAEARLQAGDIDRVILVGGMSRMPAVGLRLTGMFGGARMPAVDPDLSVALGAAVQGGLITGENLDQILLDVTAHTLSLAALSPSSRRLECEPVIPRNTPVPAVRSNLFRTISDGQKLVELKIYQGESRRPEDNILIGRTDLELTPAEAHCPIEVEYSYDLNGLVQVRAEQMGYSRRTALVIDSRNPQGLASQALELLDEGGEPAADQTPAGAGINFAIRKARSRLEKLAGPDRDILAGLLARYQAALAAEADDLDDLEDELLNFMDER